MQVGGAGAPLWVDGELVIQVRGPGASATPRTVQVRRPYALIGRTPGADLRVDAPAVSARHAFLHLDRRGVFGVDLVSRTGTRFLGEAATSGWLGPGDWLEVANHRVEILELRIDGQPIDLDPNRGDPLGEAGSGTLPRVILDPRGASDPPWVLNSELVFVGRSAACGVRVEGATASRAHCVLLRTEAGAFVVDLVGRLTWLNRRPIRGASALRDGDTLTIGSSEFSVRFEGSTALALPGSLASSGALTAEVVPWSATSLATPFSADGSDPQAAFMAWMMGLFQAGHGELIRRQGEFQTSMVEALRQIQSDSAATLTAHLQRLEAIHRELAELRAEFRRLNPSGGAPPAPPSGVTGLPRPEPLRLPPRPTPNSKSPEDARASTAWLLDRIGQLEEESRRLETEGQSTWKDLFGRLTTPRRPG